MASLGDLVAGISHEVNTPLGICLTSISHMKEMSQILFKSYDNRTLTNKSFDLYKKDLDLGLSLSLNNITRASELIRSFKQVAVEQSAEHLHSFNLYQLIDDSVKTVSPKLKKKLVTASIAGNNQLELTSYPGAISQIIINLAMNSLTHGFTEQTNDSISSKAGEINIHYQDANNDMVAIVYKDNGKAIY